MRREICKIESNEHFLISFCIITKNQSTSVMKLLKILSKQIIEDTEVLIIDDSDDVNTFNVYKNFNYLNFLKYYKGKKEGFDQAIIKALKLSKGRFVWWFGDDIIVENGYEKIIKIIRSKIYCDFFWLNYFQPLVGKWGINPDTKIKSKNDLIKKLGPNLGFISTCIFNRKIALKVLNDSNYLKYNGSMFLCLYVMLFVISKTKNFFIINEPFIENIPNSPKKWRIEFKNSDGKIKNNAFDVFAIKYIEILNEFKNYFSYEVLNNEKKIRIFNSLKAVYVGWVCGWDTPYGQLKKILKISWNIPKTWFIIALFFLPKKLNYKIYLTYKYLKKTLVRKKI